MAIDPLRLVEQRRAVTDDPHGKPETICACGARTRSRSGLCKACMKRDGLGTTSTENLIRLAADIAAELKRRRERISAALGDAT